MLEKHWCITVIGASVGPILVVCCTVQLLMYLTWNAWFHFRLCLFNCSRHCYGEVVHYPAGGWENWTCGVLLKGIFGQNECLLVNIMCWSSVSLTCGEEEYGCWKEEKLHVEESERENMQQTIKIKHGRKDKWVQGGEKNWFIHVSLWQLLNGHLKQRNKRKSSEKLTLHLLICLSCIVFLVEKVSGYDWLWRRVS